MNKSFWVTFTSVLAVEDPRSPHPKGLVIAKHLHAGLRDVGIKVSEVENWRDVGYSIDCVIEDVRVYLFFSHIGRETQQWALCCTSDLGWISSLLGKRDDRQRRLLAEAVDAVLKRSGEFSNIRWYSHWKGQENGDWGNQPV